MDARIRPLQQLCLWLERGIMVAGFILASVKPAWANQPPGPQMLLAEILILPLMMLVTALGGGYAVMRSRGMKRRWWLPILPVVAIFLSGMHEGFALLLMIVFAVFAVQRGARMISWGMTATRPPEKRAPYLAGSSAVRLITAGFATCVVAVGLTGVSFAFVGWFPGEDFVEKDLKRLVAFEVAIGNRKKDSAGRPHYVAPEVDEYGRVSLPGRRGLPFLRFGSPPRGFGFPGEFKLGQEGGSFQVWIWPDRMPFFPYNYLVTLPSFYADETGQIRMIRVHKAAQRCPTDGPVYYRVTAADAEDRE